MKKNIIHNLNSSLALAPIVSLCEEC